MRERRQSDEERRVEYSLIGSRAVTGKLRRQLEEFVPPSAELAAQFDRHRRTGYVTLYAEMGVQQVKALIRKTTSARISQ